nr:RHS repeat-associated core domain-containing protein [Serratia fonticola]
MVAFIESVPQPLRFQGQYFHAESGLHYNRYRYYSPETARFITPDPIGLAGGLNQTQYVPNPTGWVDPLGLASVPGGCPETPRAKIQSELDKILSGSLDDILKIDPEAQIGYRGSLATGVKGPHKLNPDGSRKTFDPTDFDVDAFVVSDKLADAVKPNRINFRDGSRHPDINRIQSEMDTLMRNNPAFSGLRSDKLVLRIFSKAEMAKKLNRGEQVYILKRD